MIQPRLSQERAAFSSFILLRAFSGSVQSPVGVGLYLVDYPSMLVSTYSVVPGWAEADALSQKFKDATVFVDSNSVGRLWLGQKVSVPALGLTN
jgi:hypothetical protein